MSRVLELHAAVLAAGAGTRFGGIKQLAQVQGEPMLRRVIERVLSVAGMTTSVVLGAHAADIAPLMGRLPVQVIANRAWEEGISSSIRAAVGRLPGTAEGLLLVLGDQAGITAADLQRLLDCWRAQPRHIVAASYGGTVAVPAVFPREDFSALMQLRGDSGARHLLRHGGARVVRVTMASAALDIDTPEDLARVAGETTVGG